jgi:hypothetical protein
MDELKMDEWRIENGKWKIALPAEASAKAGKIEFEVPGLQGEII